MSCRDWKDNSGKILTPHVEEREIKEELKLIKNEPLQEVTLIVPAFTFRIKFSMMEEKKLGYSFFSSFVPYQKKKRNKRKLS